MKYCENIVEIPISKYKYCVVHTADCKVVTINTLSYSAHNLIIINSMAHIFESSEFNTRVHIWMGTTERILNIILSIMRDGIASHYEYLTGNHSHKHCLVHNKHQIVSDVVSFDRIDIDEDQIGHMDRNGHRCMDYYGCGCTKHPRDTYYCCKGESNGKYNPSCEKCKRIFYEKTRQYRTENALLSYKYEGGPPLEKNDMPAQIRFNNTVVENFDNLARTIDTNFEKESKNIDILSQIVSELQDKTANITENIKVLEYLKLYGLYGN